MSIENNIKKLVNKIISKKTRNSENIREIDYDILMQILKQNSDAVLVDVRSPQEHAERKISPSINIPLYELNSKAESLLPNKDIPIILYCQAGMRSIKAYMILKEKGYTNLYTLKGGLDNI